MNLSKLENSSLPKFIFEATDILEYWEISRSLESMMCWNKLQSWAMAGIYRMASSVMGSWQESMILSSMDLMRCFIWTVDF